MKAKLIHYFSLFMASSVATHRKSITITLVWTLIMAISANAAGQVSANVPVSIGLVLLIHQLVMLHSFIGFALHNIEQIGGLLKSSHQMAMSLSHEQAHELMDIINRISKPAPPDPSETRH